MAPRGRKKKGLMRDDAARDAMLEFGFGIRLINETIKELLELYGEEPNKTWKLIEDGGYSVLLERLLEKQEEQEKQLALRNKELAVEEQEEPTQEEEREVKEQECHVEDSTSPLALPNIGLAVEEQEEPTQEEEEEKEQDHHVEGARDRIGSGSTSLVGYGAETGAQSCQTDALSVTNEEVMNISPAAFQSGEATADSVEATNETVMESTPTAFRSGEATMDLIGVIKEETMESSSTAFQSGEVTESAVRVTNEAVMDSSPAAFQPREATADSRGGIENSHCGWLSSESESESEEDGHDDDEMIQLPPEPLCEELEELLEEIHQEKKRKRPSRWDK